MGPNKEMMTIKRLVLCFMLASLLALASALSVKVAIGVGAWDGVPVLLSHATHIKLGTWQLGMNLTCVGLQLLLLKREFGVRHFLQIPFSLLIGYLVNFFLYDVLFQLAFTSYLWRLLGFMLAVTLAAFVVASIMLLDVITFPLEGTCMALARRSRLSFPRIRQLVDIACILICLGASLFLGLPNVIREGTIIGTIVFSTAMGFFMKKLRPVYQKYGFIKGE